jgi:uncharacterized protein YjbJ (UPF0337 family)
MLSPIAILKGGDFMGLPNKDEVKGKLEQAKGLVKGKIGRSLGDRKMKDEGDAERTRGQIREGLGKSRRKVGETVEKIGKAIRK